MEGLIGMCFNDFVLMAADRSMSFSIIAVKHDMEKMVKLDDKLLLGVNGEPGDTTQFAEYMEKNVKLFSMRNEFHMSPASAASFIRRNLADSLRSRSAYQVNCLIAGWDSVSQKPELYYLDHLATLLKLPFALHGYGAYVSTSILDQSYKPDMDLDQGLDLMRKVIAEIQKRLIVSLPAFKVMIIDKNGIRELPDVVVDASKLGL